MDSWELIATKGENAVNHTDSTATGNANTTAYRYYVKACNSNGCSPATNYAVVPYKPTTLTATVASTSRINLTWTDKSSNETGFEIERKSGDCSSTSSWSKIKTVGQSITSYGNTGLSSGETYSYRIRAYKKSSSMPYAYGYSLYSNCKSATTP
jgi:titin